MAHSCFANCPIMELKIAVQARPATALDRKGLSGPESRIFFRIAVLWGLSVEELWTLFGLTARSTLFKWKRDPDIALPKVTLERISYILGTYKALQIPLPNEQAAHACAMCPNEAPMFASRSALDRMLSGQVAGFFAVRQYIDAQRGGWA